MIRGVGGDRNALGYFGYAYYKENTDKLKALGIDSGEGCVDPTPEAIENGSYKPLARPLFIYVNTKSLEKTEVTEFVEFYLNNASQLLTEVGYIPLESIHYDAMLNKIKK